jgi:urease accessory protein
MEPGLAMVRLLQLASPALPVGAYSYSQALESAVHDADVTGEAEAQKWIGDALEYSMGSFEAPMLWRMCCALKSTDAASFNHWNLYFISGRESAELRAETLQMGQALLRVLKEIAECDSPELQTLLALSEISFPGAFSFAAYLLKVDAESALLGYLWSWLENQVMAALKSIPLGQSAGQRILTRLGSELPSVALRARTVADDELSNFAPGLAIASGRHETLYSRLFRS